MFDSFQTNVGMTTAEATEAVVSYTVDGASVNDKRVPVHEARQLIEQAEIDEGLNRLNDAVGVVAKTM